MTAAELTRKVRRIQIRTKRAVNETLAGEYLSAFKGQGIEFEEVREYAPGDDVRSIDWNVTVRTGTPLVKRYREERQLTVMVLVDVSASGSIGSRARTKSEIAAEICALIAFSAIRSNDRVGLLMFSDIVERFIPPIKGRRNAQRMVRVLFSFEARRTGTDVACALEDSESGEICIVDSSSANVRAEWSRRWERYGAGLSQSCTRKGVGLASVGTRVGTREDCVESIVGYFARRHRERGRYR